MREEYLSSKSDPRNLLPFSMLYRKKLVEQIGSAIRRIRDACLEHGVWEQAIGVPPDWLTVTFPRSVEHVAPHVTPHVTPHVGRLVEALCGEMSRAELMRVKGWGTAGILSGLT